MATGSEARSHWQRLELIQRSAFGPQHKLLLVWLWKYAGDNGHAFPRQSQLAADMSLSRRQVIRLLSDLSPVVTVIKDGVRNSYSIDWGSLPNSVQDGPKPARRAKQRQAEICDTHVTYANDEKVTPTSPNETANGDASVTNSDANRRHPCHLICDTHVTSKVTPVSHISSLINSNETPMKLQCGLTGIEFPDELQAEAFAAAWVKWHQYRKERRLGKWKPVTVQSQLKALARVGVESAVATIETSIRQGWNGLFPERQRQGKGQQTTRERLQGLQRWADRGAS